MASFAATPLLRSRLPHQLALSKWDGNRKKKKNEANGVAWYFTMNERGYLPDDQANSKSSSSSLYARTFLLILEVSTHVTKSSMFFVTRNAGSVTVSGPTLTWP